MKQHVYVNQPELVKEMNQCITLDLGKPSYITKRLAPMLGNGILRSNGHIWAQHRKIVAPEFFMDKVKNEEAKEDDQQFGERDRVIDLENSERTRTTMLRDIFIREGFIAVDTGGGHE
ncbi:hypothetical protein FH972_001177 [Carpinus fangiana]|uniref:Cytochrome P450 n=1 Tax=Carpinus fangiana TaxID=176857 RepID=A0A5N6QDL4_9ROSI|nr:hypothetical protein FH972_001177 [Carpinus fangiana]